MALFLDPKFYRFSDLKKLIEVGYDIFNRRLWYLVLPWLAPVKRAKVVTVSRTWGHVPTQAPMHE